MSQRTYPSEADLKRSDAPASPPAIPAQLRNLTPARIGLRRAGNSLTTGELLDFQLSHARARDAVHAALQPASLVASVRSQLQPPAHGTVEVLPLHSAAPNRLSYLQRPDLGRKLDDASAERLGQYSVSLTSSSPSSHDLAMVLVDGLSALAVERHAPPLLAELFLALAKSDPAIRLAPICIVEQGRVAIGDEIAHALYADMVVVLIGERPGLSSPDSLGAYITWHPIPGKTSDAERNCISNIRPEGLSYAEAAARLHYFLRQAQRMQLTGVALKDPAPGPDPKLEAGKP